MQWTKTTRLSRVELCSSSPMNEQISYLRDHDYQSYIKICLGNSSIWTSQSCIIWVALLMSTADQKTSTILCLTAEEVKEKRKENLLRLENAWHSNQTWRCFPPKNPQYQKETSQLPSLSLNFLGNQTKKTITCWTKKLTSCKVVRLIYSSGGHECLRQWNIFPLTIFQYSYLQSHTTRNIYTQQNSRRKTSRNKLVLLQLQAASDQSLHQTPSKADINHSLRFQSKPIQCQGREREENEGDRLSFSGLGGRGYDSSDLEAEVKMLRRMKQGASWQAENRPPESGARCSNLRKPPTQFYFPPSHSLSL